MNEQKRTFQDIYLLLVSFFQKTKLLLLSFKIAYARSVRISLMQL